MNVKQDTDLKIKHRQQYSTLHASGMEIGIATYLIYLLVSLLNVALPHRMLAKQELSYLTEFC